MSASDDGPKQVTTATRRTRVIDLPQSEDPIKSKAASKAYREGYDAIDWSDGDEKEGGDDSPSKP